MEAGSGRSLPGDRHSGRTAAAGYLLPLSATSLAGGAIAATVELIHPFDHGVWLVAYLLLVGSLAPLLLGVGETAVLEGQSDARRAALQAAMWAAGTVTVPLGVLAGSRLLVLVGSAALMLSLGSMTVALHDNTGTARRTAIAAYEGLLLFLACSACVGLALAWDLPWI